MMKRFIRIAMLLCVVIVLLSALSLKTIEAKATASSWKGFQNRFSSTSCKWSVVPSPNPNGNGGLSGVAAASATDIWAVGYSSNGSTIQTLVERWTGTSWQVVKSPNVGTHPTFSAVAAVSAHDVWAVGSHGSNTAFFQTLTEQWNGEQWSVVKSPSPGSFSTQLLGVAAVSPTNVWAVGYADSNTLTEHFHC